MDSKFWNNVYDTKAENGVSWYQEVPSKSLDTILSLKLPSDAAIIDVGGGQSKLAENLYAHSFRNLSVLDISEVALNKLKESLNKVFPSNDIQTISSNIIEAKFDKNFDLWHDRAVFHFLTSPEDQAKYVELLTNSLAPNAHFLILTFSKHGPKKCSGLDICQYNKEDLEAKFSMLKLIDFGTEDHHTPFETVQNFTYCLFQKVN
jgi:ubiquinone/menaquinone biosynthesis C-methylase UbiE